MSKLSLVETRLRAGVWEGRLSSGADAQPEIDVTHLGAPLEGVTLSPVDGVGGEFDLRVPVPAELISDGIQTFLISDRTSGDQLASFSVVAGDVLDGDIRAELSLVRAELDMLKKAFRRAMRDNS